MISITIIIPYIPVKIKSYFLLWRNFFCGIIPYFPGNTDLCGHPAAEKRQSALTEAKYDAVYDITGRGDVTVDASEGGFVRSREYCGKLIGSSGDIITREFTLSSGARCLILTVDGMCDRETVENNIILAVRRLDERSGDNKFSLGDGLLQQFGVTDVSAVEGVNYTVEPASGVLNFTGNSTEFITFTIINQAGIYTGNVKFVVDLLSATNNVEVCALTRATVTIEDIDHPLAAILGQYTASCYDLDSGDIDYTITLSPDEKDVSLVWVDYIVPMFSDYKSYGDGSIYGKVSADLNTITFPVGQTTSFNVGYGNMQVLGCYYDDGYYTVKEDIVFTRQEDGSFVTDSGICCVDQYVWPGYGGFILGKVNGKQTVWTPAK